MTGDCRQEPNLGGPFRPWYKDEEFELYSEKMGNPVETF